MKHMREKVRVNLAAVPKKIVKILILNNRDDDLSVSDENALELE